MGAIRIYFRLPPDLYLGQLDTVPLNLRYRYQGVGNGRTGNLTIKLNGSFVSSIVLLPGETNAEQVLSETVGLPVASLSRFGNTLTAEFSFGKRDQNDSDSQNKAQFGAIEKDTTLNLRSIPHLVVLPDLGMFAESGYPFTQYADLSRSAVVMPQSPTFQEMSVFLGLMGALGAHTGYPALRVELETANTVSQVRDRDLVVIGSPEDQELFRRWAENTPLLIDSSGFRLTAATTLRDRIELLLSSDFSKTQQAIADILNGATPPDYAAESFESPLAKGRTVVFLASREARSAEPLLNFAAPTGQDGTVSGNISLFNGDEFQSFTLGSATYFVGSQGWYQWIVYWATKYYLVFPAFVVVLISFAACSLHVRLQERADLRLGGEIS